MIFSATLRRTGRCLLGHVDDAHAPLADLFQQLVRADDRAGALGERRQVVGRGGAGLDRGRLQEALLLLVDLEQGVQPVSQPAILAADLVEVGPACHPVFDPAGHLEDGLFIELDEIHWLGHR